MQTQDDMKNTFLDIERTSKAFRLRIGRSFVRLVILLVALLSGSAFVPDWIGSLLNPRVPTRPSAVQADSAHGKDP